MHILINREQNGNCAASGLIVFENIWDDLYERVSEAFRLNDKERNWLRAKEVARLISAIPFLAGCENPKQTAASHLSIYLLSVMKPTKSLFHHVEWIDDKNILNRLQPISNFINGDLQIIERGMNLLSLNMLCGYERDLQKDIKMNKYNPINKGVWNYNKIRDKLIFEIERVVCPEMDEIFDMDVGIYSFWGR